MLPSETIFGALDVMNIIYEIAIYSSRKSILMRFVKILHMLLAQIGLCEFVTQNIKILILSLFLDISVQNTA